MDDGRQRAALFLRVSTDEQTNENQRPALVQAARTRGLEIVAVYEEVVSAASKKRSEFDRMMVDAHAGKFDVLLVAAIDRLQRSMVGAVDTILKLDAVGAKLVSLREPWLDMASPVRGLLVAIFGWIGEQERLNLKARTKLGIERARREGKRIGRPRVQVDLDEALSLRRRGLSIGRAAKKLGIGRSTLHRVYQAHDALNGAVSPIPKTPPPAEDSGVEVSRGCTTPTAA